MIRFMKNIVYKIPPGGAKPLVTHSLLVVKIMVSIEVILSHSSSPTLHLNETKCLLVLTY